MLDVEPVITAELEQLFAAPVPEPDWDDVRRRARAVDRSRTRAPRRVLVLAAAAAFAIAVVAVAIAAALGGFSTWLSGEPGKPASQQAQAAFDRSTRSWRGFPRSTQLRQLISAQVGSGHYTLYGFRGAGSLCLRLVATGSISGTQLACAPLAELRARSAPALVLAADFTLGSTGRTVTQGPLSLHASRAAVSFGVLADGVDGIEVTHQTPAPTRVLLGGDAFLAISPGLSPFNTTTAIVARAGKTRAAVPFAPQPTPYGRQPPLSRPSPAGPSAVQRTVKGGAISWFARRQLRGQPVPAHLHGILANKANVIFARMLTPDPRIPELVVVSIRPAGKAYFGGRLHNNHQVCAELIGGRYTGGGCWPAGRLFSTAPFTATVTQQYGDQVVAVTGVASDQVARMSQYSATGAHQQVPLHDNTYLALATLADYPLRLVAYDNHGRIIGIKTFEGDLNAPVMSRPAPGAHWKQVVTNTTGTVYTVRSTTGGTCVGFRESSGAATFACDQNVAPNALALSTTNDDKQSVILGRVGTNITQVSVQLRNGRTLTLRPIHGYLLQQLPHVSRDPSAGVARVQGLDSNGRVVAQQSFRR